ncbi:hypothetical protein FA95DRAFT_1567810 [Auriscalpium vulgare]|uniref:Uncharacterized protein n=1 Tax=Auriscalpium vulgare TaxID=40419 RepID=A0ACB8R2Q7_9AGAM|nr:hypothetical protein FA95DRAFT_1567810 [Auriscalpium vulgare]
MLERPPPAMNQYHPYARRPGHSARVPGVAQRRTVHRFRCPALKAGLSNPCSLRIAGQARGTSSCSRK